MSRSRLSRRSLGLQLAAIGVLGAVAGCSVSHEVMELALRSNVERPCPWELSFSLPAEAVYAELLAALRDARATVVARDEGQGFVSWVHGGGGFTAASVGGAGAEDPDSVQHVVHGSARVRSVPGGSVVSLHCVRRRSTDSAVQGSNGEYEQVLLGLLAKRLWRQP